MTIPPNEALARLRDGNARFASDSPVRVTGSDAALRHELSDGQRPFAVVIGCADSRVPVEAVFDQAAGDLFVIRVAGNLAGPTQIGSAEYAVAALGCRLVLVLGHTGCGAVRAALDQGAIESLPPALQGLIAGIRAGLDGIESEEVAVQANVRNAMDRLADESGTAREAIDSGQLVVMGGVYDLASGEVTFLDG